MSPPVLFGLRVLLTRPAEQAEPWRRALADAGAEVVALPLVTVGPPPSWEPLDRAFAALASYDWLVFTSAGAVRLAVPRLPPEARADGWTTPRVAAVGAQTAAALTAAGLPVHLCPEDERQEGLIQSLASVPPGTRVLFPQAVGGRPELAAALRAQGCVVDVVPASQTVPVHPPPPLPAFDAATFASPSALEAFVTAYGAAALRGRPLLAIGPTTAAAAARLGLEALVAARPNVQAVISILSDLQPARGDR
jgi:uroporphyrinogen-III synthase